MSDNTRLSSTQALEDYFVDLLLEPEPEPETKSEPSTGTATSSEANSELLAQATQASVEEAGVVDSGALDQDEETPRPDCQLSQDAGLLSAPISEPSEAPQLTEIVKRAEAGMPAAKPFDFASMDDDARNNERSMSSPVLDNVQRLLNQVNKVSQEKPSVSAQEPSSTIDAELADDWQQVMAHEQTSTSRGVPEVEQPIEEIAEPQPVQEQNQQSDLEQGQAVSQTLETKASEDLPPDNWSQQIHQGDEFQALFFEVNGVIFAVPLTELGGIHQLGDVNRLLGRPPWYLGLMSSREHQLDVVDTACWAMPDKLDGEEYREQYKYVVVLGESSWGLACNTLLGTETLSEHSVRWREKAGKRPWLAGMVKEKMCALIHVSELISMLKAGLDVNTKLRQS